ncbi:MAG: type II toxin-antitoxin system HicB family antitoxin [Chitinispirillaceae bacterium]|nr:type II toxin-antitoxin system HicB family antitoxin [Chitinispirillaceae bacterium]
MKYYSFNVVIEKESEDEGYYAYSPTLPGCFSNGRTIEEARTNIREAIEQHIESLVSHGMSIPQNENIVHVEGLSIGVPA